LFTREAGAYALPASDSLAKNWQIFPTARESSRRLGLTAQGPRAVKSLPGGTHAFP